MKKMLFVVVLSVFALILAACGPGATPEPLEVTIIMTEYAFEPAELEFQVGQQVTLNLVNEGALIHEIMFGRDMMMMDGVPSGYEVDMFEMAGVEPHVSIMAEGEMSEDHEHMEGEEEEHEHPGFMVAVPVGDDLYSMTFTVTEDMLGEWEYGCFELEGVHYTAGMIGSLTVIE
jgi:plastocyanin